MIVSFGVPHRKRIYGAPPMKNDAGKTVYQRMSLRRFAIIKVGTPKSSMCIREKATTNIARKNIQKHIITPTMRTGMICVCKLTFAGSSAESRLVGFSMTMTRNMRGTTTIHTIAGVRVAKAKVMTVLFPLSMTNRVYAKNGCVIRLMISEFINSSKGDSKPEEEMIQFTLNCPTACVTRWWVGRGNAALTEPA
jgi:hypothetical protein